MKSRCKVLQASCSGVHVLKLVGEVRLNLCSTIDRAIESTTTDPNFATVVVDLTETTLIDSTTLGMLAKLAILAKKKSHFLPSIISTNPDITRIITTMGFDTVFIILEKPAQTDQALKELPISELSEDELRANVLNAHKVLMKLNEHNREQFKDLVATLEQDVDEQAAYGGL
jgi:anti-anti-sigma factor